MHGWWHENYARGRLDSSMGSKLEGRTLTTKDRFQNSTEARTWKNNNWSLQPKSKGLESKATGTESSWWNMQAERHVARGNENILK